MKERIIKSVIEKIESKYKDDIDLLIEYGSKEKLAFYFVPNSERGKELSFQFVIENQGIDLFPIPWDRMTSIVAFDTPITYVIGNSNILYARNNEVVERFNQFKNGIMNFVQSGPSEALLNKAYEYLNDAYVNLYNINLGTSDITDRRIEAMKIIGKLTQAVGYANGVFYQDGIRKGVKESFSLKLKPVDYQVLIESTMNATTKEEVTMCIEKLLWNTREFLKAQQAGYAEAETYDLMIGYYEEWVKLINQAELAVKENNKEELFMIVGFFLEEIAQFLTAVATGVWFNDRNVFNEYKESLHDLLSEDLFNLVRVEDYTTLMNNINEFGSKFRQRLIDNGINIAEFSTVEDFEKALSEK
jgi:dsDNA-binding SOS-regulon protein